MKKLFLLISILFLIGCDKTEKVTVVKLGHSLDQSHSVHQTMVYMNKILVEKSSGKMRVDIYPGGQLGNERELIELLQIGSLGMTKVSASPMESFVPEMKVFSLPYVFRSEDHLWRVLKSDIGKKLLHSGQDYFLRGMCYYDAGSRSFYTKEKPVNSPKDLEGLKIRVMKSKTATEMIQTLGGSATPIAWGELYTALQQGVVDAAENNPPSFYLSRHYEVCKYYSLDEHTSIPDILLMSTKVWNKLSEQEQNWLQEAVDESVDYQKTLWKESSDDALKKVQENGVEVIYPDKSTFQECVQSLKDAYKGTSIYELLEAINNIE